MTPPKSKPPASCRDPQNPAAKLTKPAELYLDPQDPPELREFQELSRQVIQNTQTTQTTQTVTEPNPAAQLLHNSMSWEQLYRNTTKFWQGQTQFWRNQTKFWQDQAQFWETEQTRSKWVSFATFVFGLALGVLFLQAYLLSTTSPVQVNWAVPTVMSVQLDPSVPVPRDQYPDR